MTTDPRRYLGLDEGNERGRLRNAYLLAACNEGRRRKDLPKAVAIEPETIKKGDEL